jgi:hypothetical protein
MGPAVDHRAAGAADSLATIIVKCNRVFAGKGQLLVDHIQHFDKGHMNRYVFSGNGLEMTLCLGPRLAPDFQGYINRFR